VPKPAPESSDKVNNFMKFMDDIEEEMSSQYSQSAARRKKLESEDEWSSRPTNIVANR